MKTFTAEEIKNKLKEIWRDESPDVRVSVQPSYIEITLSATCDAPGLSFSKLSQLSAFFQTNNIGEADQFSYPGCDTCDYGSSYGFTLRVKPDVSAE